MDDDGAATGATYRDTDDRAGEGHAMMHSYARGGPYVEEMLPTLTDAIDARLGPIVSPVVTKPLWGPWRVRIAMPLTRPAPLGRILAITHGVLSGIDRGNPGHYRIVLTPKERHPREGRMGRCALNVQR